MEDSRDGDRRLTVKAVYKFKATNNDELTFKKGELITVTQQEDGGWWEGTSHESGKTGWFPSNYVKVFSVANAAAPAPAAPGQPSTSSSSLLASGFSARNQDPAVGDDSGLLASLEKQALYRKQLVAELVDKEKDFVQGMRNLVAAYLAPLGTASPEL